MARSSLFYEKFKVIDQDGGIAMHDFKSSCLNLALATDLGVVGLLGWRRKRKAKAS